MRQFDIVRLHDRKLAVILQTDLLDERETRVVAPLLGGKGLKMTPKLHLKISVGNKAYILATEKLSAIEKSEIASIVGSAADHEYDIRRALDIVFSGF